MKLSSRIIGIVVVGILFLGIGISKEINLWQTESTKVPVKFSEGEFAGEYNPEDIRGSYTFKEIKDSFQVPIEDLAKAFGIDLDPKVENFQVKELENIYSNLEEPIEIGTSSVRYFVAIYTGLPYELTETIYLPSTAVELLKEKNKLNQEQLEYFKTHSVEINRLKSNIEYKDEEHDIEDGVIKGKTTFKELLDWGVAEETIENIIEGKIPSNAMTVRDYCTEKGISFSEIKTTLQKEVVDK